MRPGPPSSLRGRQWPTRQSGGFLRVRLRRRRAGAPRGRRRVVQVVRLGIGEADFLVQFDPRGNPHALGGSPPVRMILTVDDPDARRVQKS